MAKIYLSISESFDTISMYFKENKIIKLRPEIKNDRSEGEYTVDLLEELEDLGVNVDEGEERLMGNEALYTKMLGMFAKMMRTSAVDPDFNSDNCDDMIEKTHAIKGAAGNLSITPIYEAYSEIVSLLRAHKPEQAKEKFEKILPLQTEIVNCIEKYI